MCIDFFFEFEQIIQRILNLLQISLMELFNYKYDVLRCYLLKKRKVFILESTYSSFARSKVKCNSIIMTNVRFNGNAFNSEYELYITLIWTIIYYNFGNVM